MLTLSKLSDYAIVLVSCLATLDAYTASARTLARATEIPLPTVVKLLKILATGGTLRSIQGRSGGYRLTRAPSEVPLTEIIEAVDGPIAVTECNRETGDCRIQDRCLVHRHWVVINGAFRQALTGISLADLTGPPLRIEGALRFDRASPSGPISGVG
ncbi:MAG: SUF system Fe-S cluster assembly regulator [Pseudomonadota bacterium]|nr:SUF system Fe-S cluster assembly regulator [Pseudomonadota bacterium]